MFLIFHIIANHSSEKIMMPPEGIFVGIDADGQKLYLNSTPFAEDAFRLYVVKEQLRVQPSKASAEVLLNGRTLDCEGIIKDRSRVTLRGGSFLFYINSGQPEMVEVYVEQEPVAASEEAGDEYVTAMTVMSDGALRQMLSGMVTQTGPEGGYSHADSSGGGAISTISLPEGTQLGKYSLGRQIGKGGMGVVYLARHEGLGILRVLKMLSSALEKDDPLFRERFAREARMAAKIRHPNVVEVLDLDHDDGVGIDYIVMEYMDGGTLRNLLKSQGKLEEELAFVILFGITEALVAAAAAGIVHRDIKPDNIMFTRQGEVKLADLGIGKSREEDTQLTKSESMLGTPAYLPPEQVENPRDVDIRADLYSLGATAFEMVTGHTPYAAKTVYDTLHKLFHDPVPDARAENSALTEWFAWIISKLMAKNPEERFQTPSELLSVLSNGPYLTGVSERMTVVAKILESIQVPDTSVGGAKSSMQARSVFLSSLHRTGVDASSLGSLAETGFGGRGRRIRRVLLSSLLGVLFPVALGLAGLASWQWRREREQSQQFQEKVADQERQISDLQKEVIEKGELLASQDLAKPLETLLQQLGVWDGTEDIMAGLATKILSASQKVGKIIAVTKEQERAYGIVADAVGLSPSASLEEICGRISSLKAQGGSVDEQVAHLRGQLQQLLEKVGLWEGSFVSTGVPSNTITKANLEIESALRQSIERRAIAEYLGLGASASLEYVKEEIVSQKKAVAKAARDEWRPVLKELGLTEAATSAEAQEKLRALEEMPQVREQERLRELVEKYSLPADTATIEEAIERIVQINSLDYSVEVMTELLHVLETLRKTDQALPISAAALANVTVDFVLKNADDSKAITMMEQGLAFFFVGIQKQEVYKNAFGSKLREFIGSRSDVTEKGRALFRKLCSTLGISVSI